MWLSMHDAALFEAEAALSRFRAVEQATAHNNVAIDLLHSGRTAEAAAGFRAALAVQPDGAEAYYNLGIAFKDQGRHHDSVRAYDAALALRPVFPEASFNAGRALQMLADDPGPLGLLRPSMHAARQAALRRAAEHFAASAADGRATTGSGDMDAGAGRRPSADAYRSLEEVLYQLGDHDGAQRAHAAFVAQSPKDGLRPRRRVPCARLREALAQAEDDATGSAASLPPLSICSPVTKAPAAAREHFAARGYATVRDLLAPDALEYVRAYYTARRARGEFYRDEPDPRADREHDSILSKDRHALDNDDLGLHLAAALAPLVEDLSGVAVKPGFVKVAAYETGAQLPPHRDQVQNYLSISLLISSSSRGASSSAWPLVMLPAPDGNASSSSASSSASPFSSTTPAPHRIEATIPVGGGFIFLGRDFLHWRPCCLGAQQSSMVVLLHYVPQRFPEVACTTRLQLSPDSPSIHHDCAPTPPPLPPSSPLPPPPSSSPSMPPATAGLATEDACDAALAAVVGQVDGFSGGGEEERGPREACDDEAAAWLGPLHEVPLHELSADSRYLLYSPCVTGAEAGHCYGQFNNQLSLLLHALAVAMALRRTLVLPPFVWMEHQMAATQRWFGADHYLDMCALRRLHPVVTLEAFAAAANASGATLPHVHFPPYLLPDRDTRSFDGSFFTARGLRFAAARRMAAHAEATQATSGRAEVAYRAGEGLGYWRSVALHLGRQQREHAQLMMRWGEDGSGSGSGSGTRRGSWEEWQRAEAVLVGRHASELGEWAGLAREHPDLQGEPLTWRMTRREDAAAAAAAAAAGNVGGQPLDALVFDYAPSYSFGVDQLRFDAELTRLHRHVRFAPRLRAAAAAAAARLFGDEPFVAAHLRRDGYEHYCAGSGLRHYGGRRYGVGVTRQMCFPSVGEVAAAIQRAQARHGARRVLLATNSRDELELRGLAALVPYERWVPPDELLATAPELLPTIELLMCARAAAFVGTWPSTFSATVVARRDVRGLGRNTTSFFGFAPDDAPWVNDDAPRPGPLPEPAMSAGGGRGSREAPPPPPSKADDPALRVSAVRVVRPIGSLAQPPV